MSAPGRDVAETLGIPVIDAVAAARRGARCVRPSQLGGASPTTRRAGRYRRGRCHHPVDVGQHVAAEVGAFDPGEYLPLGTQRGRCFGAGRTGSPAQRPAALPCPWPDLRAHGGAGRRIRRDLHAGVRSRGLLRLADRVSADLVHRGSLVSSGDSFRRRPAEARPRSIIVAPRPLRLGDAAGRGAEQARSAVRRSGHRDLRHDRRQLAGRVEPSGPAQAGLRGPPHRARNRDPRRRRSIPGTRPTGRNRAARSDRHAGLRKRSRGDGVGVSQRLVPHRRPRVPATRTDMCSSSAARRRSSSAAACKSLLPKSKTRCSPIPTWSRPWLSPFRMSASAKMWRSPSSRVRMPR